MQFTPAQIKDAFAPYLAKTGKSLDVATMKAAQGQAADTARLEELAIQATQGGESAHEVENGFTSFVRMNEAVYKAVKIEGIAGARLSSPQEALSFASARLESIQSNLTPINRYGNGDASVGGAYEEKQADHPLFSWINDRKKDWLEGSRMDLYVNVEYLKATFGIEDTILERRDGKLQIRAFDIVYNGKAIGRSIGDGSIIPYREGGTLKLDRFV